MQGGLERLLGQRRADRRIPGRTAISHRALHNAGSMHVDARLSAHADHLLETVRVAPARASLGQPVGGILKRCLDLAIVVPALIVLSPLMLLLAALIRVFTGGPAIFAQERVGFGGRLFVCYKFRTMAVNGNDLLEDYLASDPRAAAEWRDTRKLRNDPRVGCLGNVLRKSSLDELPQLFNVLRGDMSCVGPRPIVPDEVRLYGRHARQCFEARPGLTGLWQTSGRNRMAYSQRVSLDRYYARHWSVWLDLGILGRTVPAVLKFDQTA